MPPRGGRYPPIKVAQLFGGVGPILCSKVEQDFFRFKLDAMSVPEALATTICGLAVWLLCYLLIKSPIGAEGVGGAGGAYNLAWHALSRPTPFSFATVNKTKSTSPPGHTMWGLGSPSLWRVPAPTFGGDGRPCQRAGVRRARSLGCAGWPRVGRTSRAGSGGRVSVGLDNSGS